MTPSEWQSSCAIGLASCRLRAEYLARQIYCKPFTSMDDRPAAVVRCPPCRQQSQSSTSVNGSTGSWPSPPPPQDASNFLVRTGRALYDRLFSLLQDQASDCVVQYCEQGSNADDPSPTSSVDEPADTLASQQAAAVAAADPCGRNAVVVEEPRSAALSERLPQSPAVVSDAVSRTPSELEVKSAENVKGDAEEEPRRYPAERDVVRAALAHRVPDDGFPFPIVQELVRPGVLVHNESDSSCDLSDDAFHDAADGLAEEFRDGSGSSETSNEEKAQTVPNDSGKAAAPVSPPATVATTDNVATVSSPAAVSSPPAISSVASSPTAESLSSSGSSSTQGASPSRPRSSRFAKHRFAEAPPRKVTPKPAAQPEHAVDESSSSSSSETLSPVIDTKMPPATPPKRDSADSDDDESARAVLVRSTSLKSGKSPPGTPFKKKIVRFADALGLDLAAVRTIVSEELPFVPASAFTHLQLAPLVRSPPPCTLELKALFSQPGASPTFMTRLTSQRVCLESVVSSGCALHAVIRVLNVAFEKLVVLRYSLDNWRSFCDLRAVYLPGSSDGISDRFGVDVYLTPQGEAQVQMCVRYVVGDQEYWDNNDGANYCFEFRDSPKDEPEVTPLMNYL
uniref:Protein phosphatase 1 regulatory subunit 3A/B/C/D/E n=1 Tax=Rhipicephalus zambeziensis TaxID=60191 RepID=A0A224Z571_9ACAR